jgi:hypothetical protein
MALVHYKCLWDGHRHGSEQDLIQNDHAEQHCPGAKLPFPPILTVSLSPLSICSCIRSSAFRVSDLVHSKRQQHNELNLFSSPPTALPWTTFSRNIFATSSACCILFDVSSDVARARFWSKLARAARRAADSVGRSPVYNTS